MNSAKPTRYLRNVAAALAAGPWKRRDILDRLRLATADANRRFTRFLKQLFTVYPQDPPADVEALVPFVVMNRQLLGGARMGQLFWFQPQMAPRGVAANWNLPHCATTSALADWLQIDARQLDWYADVQGRNALADDDKLRHYHSRWQRKPSGGWRLLEAPKPSLKAIQRQLLREILDNIPTHDAAHGFRAGRSVLTYVAPHVGKPVVLRFDLRDFFPSTPVGRIFALFRYAGYPVAVARALTGLCTTRTLDRAPGAAAQSPFRHRHLPQGAPTSPALANLCAYRFDVRLMALAQSLGADYTRYADDLAISGGPELAQCSRRIRVLFGQIAADEGYALNFRKCRVMGQGGRQQLAGVVVNQRPNIGRDEYDRLKAILTNCIRHGPESQNREGANRYREQLRGRTEWIRQLNPNRGAVLQALFDHISWQNP